jgi:pilus assembly protein CpaF
VIEDTAELRISHPNLLAAECQMETIQSKIDFDTLLRASLRWRPDRIILGEVRGHEARTLLDSFNTGHGGSMTTIHANSPVAALNRFGELAMRSHQQNVRDDLAVEIADSVQYVVQVRRFANARKVSAVVHVTGYSRQLKAYEYDTVYSLTEESSLIPSTLRGL